MDRLNRSQKQHPRRQEKQKQKNHSQPRPQERVKTVYSRQCQRSEDTEDLYDVSGDETTGAGTTKQMADAEPKMSGITTKEELDHVLPWESDLRPTSIVGQSDPSTPKGLGIRVKAKRSIQSPRKVASTIRLVGGSASDSAQNDPEIPLMPTPGRIEILDNETPLRRIPATAVPTLLDTFIPSPTLVDFSIPISEPLDMPDQKDPLQQRPPTKETENWSLYYSPSGSSSASSISTLSPGENLQSSTAETEEDIASAQSLDGTFPRATTKQPQGNYKQRKQSKISPGSSEPEYFPPPSENAQGRGKHREEAKPPPKPDDREFSPTPAKGNIPEHFAAKLTLAPPPELTPLQPLSIRKGELLRFRRAITPASRTDKPRYEFERRANPDQRGWVYVEHVRPADDSRFRKWQENSRQGGRRVE